MRKPVTDIALLAYIAKKNADVVSYTEATKACKSSSSASRALHQLIEEGLIEPQPKLIGLRYVTQYAVTKSGKQVSQLALQLTQLRESASRMKKDSQEKSQTETQDNETAKSSSLEQKEKEAQRIARKTSPPKKIIVQSTKK